VISGGHRISYAPTRRHRLLLYSGTRDVADGDVEVTVVTVVSLPYRIVSQWLKRGNDSLYAARTRAATRWPAAARHRPRPFNEASGRLERAGERR
jgi:hypothetical protein